MTIEEFDKTRFDKKMVLKYKDGGLYTIAAVDFGEYLLGIIPYKTEDYKEKEIKWVRYENVEIV